MKRSLRSIPTLAIMLAALAVWLLVVSEVSYLDSHHYGQPQTVVGQCNGN